MQQNLNPDSFDGRYTLPGTIPGLLQPGVRVRCLKNRLEYILVAIEEGCIAVLASGDTITRRILSGVVLVLDEAGCDRALRWLAEKSGLPRSFNPPYLQMVICWPSKEVYGYRLTIVEGNKTFRAEYCNREYLEQARTGIIPYRDSHAHTFFYVQNLTGNLEEDFRAIVLHMHQIVDANKKELP